MSEGRAWGKGGISGPLQWSQGEIHANGRWSVGHAVGGRITETPDWLKSQAVSPAEALNLWSSKRRVTEPKPKRQDEARWGWSQELEVAFPFS